MDSHSFEQARAIKKPFAGEVTRLVRFRPDLVEKGHRQRCASVMCFPYAHSGCRGASVSNNGHEPNNRQGVVETRVSCAACGSPVDVSAKFCSECGVERTTVPVPEVDRGTATDAPSDETEATRTTGEFEIQPVATEPLPIGDTITTAGDDVSPDARAARERDEDERAPMPAPSATAEDVRPRPWYRLPWVWVIVGVVVLGTVAAVGLVTYNAMTRRPVVAALTEAAAQFDGAIAAVAEAKTLDDLTEITEELPGWIRPIRDEQAGLQSLRGTALRAAASDVLAAQAAYLSALRPVSDLQSDDLSGWPDISEDLAAATDELTAAHDTLVDIDAAAANDAAVDPVPATSAVEVVIAVSTAENATASMELVVAEVASAKNLDGIREGGQAAAAASAELQGALQTLEGLSDAEATQERLSLQAAFLDELATLESLSDDHLASWPTTSAALAERGEDMVAAMDLSAAGRSSLSADLRELRSSVEDVVITAQRKLAQWRQSVRRAEEQRDADLAALAEYEAGYRTHIERYNDLRDQTADFTERIRSGTGVTYDEAYTAFYDGISQREQVRDAMNELSPPDALRSSHLAVVGVIDDAIAAMQAAVDGIAESQFCYFCYYEDTAGWRRFQAESDRITDEFDSVTRGWDSAVSTQRSALENLELPKKPRV